MRTLVLFLVTCLLADRAQAASIHAASCSQSDVQAAINAASDGDTIVIPEGTCTWNAGITTSKQIKIQGQTKGRVKLIMGAGISPWDAAMLHIIAGTTYRTEISNLQFWQGAGTGSYLIIDGAETDKPPLIHDNYFNSRGWQIFEFMVYRRYGGGVIYNNTFESTDNSECTTGPTPTGFGCGLGSGNIQIKDAVGGDLSWSTPSTMGVDDATGLNNIYIEDNVFTNVGSVDCDDGSRVVMRRNTFTDSPLTCQGADTSYIGNRHTQLYENVLNFQLSGTWTLQDINANPVTGYYPLNINKWWTVRGGTGIITGNVMANISSQMWGDKPEVAFQIQQSDRNAGPDPCCPGGYPCFHQVGRGQNNTLEPFYIWGNSGTGRPQTPSIENSGYEECPNNPNQSNPGYYIQANRDYYIGTAKPGWVRYSYPHPLRSGTSSSDNTPPLFPKNLRLR